MKLETGFWKFSLPMQFAIVGGAVMFFTMILVGQFITTRIEQAVVQNSASSAALYMESFISPLSQELAISDSLSEPARRALIEIFEETAIGERIVSYKIWKKGGLIVDASDPEIIGKTFEPSANLKAAWEGVVSAAVEELEDEESAAESSLGIPLLEVYSPIRQVWSGEIIAVAEFYEVADELKQELADARIKSWLLVGGAFLGSGLLLFGIVKSGGDTINRQQGLLELKVAEANEVAAQNVELRLKVISASSRASAQAEKYLSRIGADLHDGPAQYMAMAAMRIGDVMPTSEAGRVEAEAIRDAINEALSEIRTISRGLSHPDLDSMGIRELTQNVVDAHVHHSGRDVKVEHIGTSLTEFGHGTKLCLFRFLQEGLSNASRHAPNGNVIVQVTVEQNGILAEISDEGPGFDPKSQRMMNSEGGQGLLGLQDRAESLGGSLDVQTAEGKGVTLRLRLPMEEKDTI